LAASFGSTGGVMIRFLELFPSARYEDVSLVQLMALTPHELVQAHLHIGSRLLDALHREKTPVVPA
jgi:oxalate decarboxylase